MAWDADVPKVANQIAADLIAINANWELTANGVVTTAGDTVYATAANVLSRLAIGAANTKLFTNAGATAPEWAVGIKIGTFTRAMDAATGDVAYTGVGFKPSLLMFSGGVNATFIGSYLGVDNGTNRYCFANRGGVTPGTNAIFTTLAIALLEDASKNQVATVSALGADGFTLSWTRAGVTAAGTATMFYIAFR